jgi:hypothetical protein
MLGRCLLTGLALGVALGRPLRRQVDDTTPIRALFAPQGRNDLLEIIAVLCSDRRPGGAHFVDYRILGHGLRLRQFLGSTDDRCLQARASTRLLDLATDRRIRNVRKVPRDQVFHAIDGGHRNVNRVNPSLGRNRARTRELVLAPIAGKSGDRRKVPFPYLRYFENSFQISREIDAISGPLTF